MAFCFLTTVPKTGLHLMRHILGMNKIRIHAGVMAYAKDDMAYMAQCQIYPAGISGHMEYHCELADFAQHLPSFTILRDPRDTIVSAYHYMDKIPDRHPFANVPGQLDVFYRNYHGEERMDLLIENYRKHFDAFIPWLETNIKAVRYEDLIERPTLALIPVAFSTGYDLDMLVERAGYRGGKTFRKGVAGEWRHEFTDKQVRRFNELYGRVMEAWGYE